MNSIKVVHYYGSKRCCDCGRLSSYTVKVDGYQFTTCRDCVNNFFSEEEEDDK